MELEAIYVLDCCLWSCMCAREREKLVWRVDNCNHSAIELVKVTVIILHAIHAARFVGAVCICRLSFVLISRVHSYFEFMPPAISHQRLLISRSLSVRCAYHIVAAHTYLGLRSHEYMNTGASPSVSLHACLS